MKYFIYTDDGKILKVSNRQPQDILSCIESNDGNTINYDIIGTDIVYKGEAINKRLEFSRIEVNYNGIRYQGDEESQNRLSRVINSLPSDNSAIDWKASDNSINTLTRVDLQNILNLACSRYTEILLS